jgi:16S rRNA (adenine1518-N6/adenine1519-N6)-dimethyltransferase
MNLSEIKRLLLEHNVQLTRSLGQNFLHDGNQVRRIVAAGELGPSDSVLEIGPGLGALTESLVDQAGQVLAVEKDRRLYEIVRERLGHRSNLTLVCADALEFLGAASQEPAPRWSTWKMVSNLPYSVASPILVRLAQMEHPLLRLVATVQWEVAQRIRAQPGTPDYGILSLLLQIRYHPGDCHKISASCFHPPPEVDSARLTLIRRVQPLLPHSRLADYTRLVKLSFSQRRKMMFKVLSAHYPADRLEPGFAQGGISRQARAETVALEQFVSLAQFLVDTPRSAPR